MQNTSAGEREIRKALGKTLFEKAYGYIKQYY
jgi:hypothetical protein